MRFRFLQERRLDRVPAILAFEVYVLMTMRIRLKMYEKTHELEAKLSQHGLSVDDGKRLHDRIATVFTNETEFVEDLHRLLGVGDSRTVMLPSILWPEFDFEAVAGDENSKQSVGFRHVRGQARVVNSPRDLPTWSVDVAEFTNRFGPVDPPYVRPLLDDHLPNYREHTYVWDEDRYGAGFSWGLFIFAAKCWPED